MTALGVVITLFCCLSALVVPRRLIILPYIIATLYVTQGQAIEFAGLSLTTVRLVEIVTAARLFSTKGLVPFKRNSVDNCILAFFPTYCLVTLLRTGTVDMYTFGGMIDSFLVYFSFRAMFATPTDILDFTRWMALLLVPFTLFMCVEAARGRNLFAFMGGVPETPVFREGHYRAQATFRVAITAGSLGATFFPIFASLFFRRKEWFYAVTGSLCCVAITIASHSSGPLMAAVAGAIGWACWLMRDRMRIVRLAIVTILVGLHFTMSRPVWFIFDRISGIIGGDGWHRSNLIDKFLKNWDEWILIGMPMERTVDWAATVTKFGFVDVTNYYVSIGISGGLISFVIFWTLLRRTFRTVGDASQVLAQPNSDSDGLRPILWGYGVAVCAHAINLTAVSYWDQSYVIWYLHLAIAVSLASSILGRTSNPDDATLPEYLNSNREFELGGLQGANA